MIKIFYDAMQLLCHTRYKWNIPFHSAPERIYLWKIITFQIQSFNKKSSLKRRYTGHGLNKDIVCSSETTVI